MQIQLLSHLLLNEVCEVSIRRRRNKLSTTPPSASLSGTSTINKTTNGTTTIDTTTAHTKLYAVFLVSLFSTSTINSDKRGGFRGSTLILSSVTKQTQQQKRKPIAGKNQDHIRRERGS